ncbi:MAG TPA: hypothetical protein PK668_09805 [Myxococcota bacterium]|nr:hypothetical protein [Myxococcota bacterium]HRY93541.1 hypothetical protein [Myxococcota bacterium]HSA21237.1 hypothetical protein [Myxococcota bacterium]
MRTRLLGLCAVLLLPGVCLGQEAPPAPGDAAAAPGAAPAGCQDPIFIQVKGRLSDLLRAEEQIDVWEEFLRNYPHNPCVQEARRELEALQASGQRREEQAREEGWRQQARGGIIEPGHLDFPAHAGLLDASPGYRIRLDTDVLVLDDWFGFKAGVENTVWTQLLRAEVALIPWIGVRFELPTVMGTHRNADATYALGNMVLGLRGHWGTYLQGEDDLPLLVSGGFLWGSSSSVWMSEDKRGLLDAAAFATPYSYHRFAYDARDYAFHVEGQLRVAAEHFLALGLQYHVMAGGEHVEKIFLYDLAYDWRVAGLVYLGLELNGGVGLMPAFAMSTDNAWRAWVLLSPQARLDLGLWELGLSVRVPLGQAADWASVIVGLELAVDLGGPVNPF